MPREPPTVLIVDDEEDVVEIYALALDEYDVRKAYSGEGALEKVDDSVDVVLLDRRMPGLSGHEVLDEIRERDVDVRVAMVTAVDPDFDIAEMDFDAYLTKPVDGEKLRGLVDELLALSEFDDRSRELFSIAERKATLEAEKTDRELAESEEYEALQERSAELNERATEAMDEIDDEAFGKLLSGVPADDTED